MLIRSDRGAGDRERCRLMPSDPRPRAKKRKPRQEISACLKWIVFLFNFLVFLVGVSILALGVYLFIKDFGEVKPLDVILNPAILLAVIGFSICVVSMMGALGALRDNIFLLKCFALCVFFSYILIVVFTFVLFILFYSDSTDGLSAHSVLLYAIKNYHTNRNLAEIVDSLQENLHCCGVSSIAQGYRDWNLSYQFNCTTSNPQPEKCGVPYSCCKKSVISEAAGSSNPLLPAMRSLECWQNALNKRPPELEHDLHTRGCLPPLRSLFESHAVHIGAVVAIIIIPVCLSVCLTNVLARQIDHQKFLLEREARREERRRKRDRRVASRTKDKSYSATRLEEGKAAPFNPNSPPKLPDNPPPPRPPPEQKRKAREISPPSGKPLEPPGDGPPKKRERRKKSASAVPPVDPRVHHWVLQQSDLVPDASN